LRLAADLPVAGFPSRARRAVLARGAERPAIQVSCAGTLVADDVGELHALDLDGPPWIGCEISGLIDFPGFTVSPGSRRGVVPDRAAEAFARAMIDLRPRSRTSSGDWTVSVVRADRQVVEELAPALRGLRVACRNMTFPGSRRRRRRCCGRTRLHPSRWTPEERASRELDLFPAGDLGHGEHRSDPVGSTPGMSIAAREARTATGVIRVVSSPLVHGGRRLFSRCGGGARGGRDSATRPGATARLRVEVEQGPGLQLRRQLSKPFEPLPDEAGFGIRSRILVDAARRDLAEPFDGRPLEVNQMHEDYLA